MRRIAIVVDGAMIRAVAVHRRRVVGTAECQLDDPAELVMHLASLFEALGGLSRRAVILVALDRPAVQLKVITDAPVDAERRLLEKALLENADRYFIGGDRMRYFGVSANAGGAAIVACERRTVDALAKAAFDAGARALVVVSSASIEEASTSQGSGRDAPSVLANLNERKAPSIRIEARARRLGLRKAAALSAVAVAILVLGLPVLSARRTAATARADLAAIGDRAGLAIRGRNERDSLRRLIDRIKPGGILMTNLLSEITKAMPVRASLLALTVDTTKGSAVILATDAVATLPSLDSLSAIENVRLSGPVTRERIADRDLERATIVFTLRQGR